MTKRFGGLFASLFISFIITISAGLTSLAYAGQLATLDVVNQSTGERLKVWRHEGRNYVAGNPDDRYAIQVRNRTGARLLSVVSVDGINVITGATAATNQSGYVLDAGQSFDIKGWRKNMDEVAAFYFSRLPDSYAARTGRPDNIGVIGIAVFQEYVEPVAMQEQSIERAAPSAPVPGTLAKRADNAAGAPADPKIGTGHGERLTSNTWMTDFHRIGTQPNEVLIIYYDTYAHLATRGIIPGGHENVQGPLPFPGKFVPDPS